jgi:hypothetical protein
LHRPPLASRGRTARAFTCACALAWACTTVTRDARAGGSPAPAEDALLGKPRYFYFHYDYGSQSLFGPGSVFLNRGLDVFQLRPANRNPVTQAWGHDSGNVLRSMASPFSTIASRGWGRFVQQELLPLSFTTATARWAPNYGLHLIGGGATYRELAEWFDQNDVPLPAVWSAATMYAAAFVNESLENKRFVGPNTDCLADLYVFDLAGILLFSIDPVARFFSQTVRVSDWSLQPAFAIPSGALHNQGNYYAVKVPIPFTADRLRWFGYMGFSTLGGLSVRVTPELSVSAAAGGRITSLENSNQTTLENMVTARPSAAVFLDKNDSLLASVQVSDVSDYFVHVNVYPNALFHSKPGLGAWTVVSRDAHWLAGLSFTGTLGFGVAAGTL